MSRYKRQTSAKYASRPSPPFHATEFCGLVTEGNDGNLWESVENNAGTYCQWRKLSHEDEPMKRQSPRAKRSSPAKRRSPAKRGSAKRASASKRVRRDYVNVPAKTPVQDANGKRTSRPYETGDWFEINDVVYVRKGDKWVQQ